MATNTTKTFLQLVNDTIDEAGAELASFAEDGSDFDTNTDAMMNRFKKWVRKAWKTIQQEQFDWEWMQSLAVVNLSPGIMFYSNQPIGFTTGLINPAVIVDVDNSVSVSGLTVSKTYDLTRNYADTVLDSDKEYFGYMDVSYTDNSYENPHPLDFGLKAGGQRITREGGFPQLRFGFSGFPESVTSMMEEGAVVESIMAASAQPVPDALLLPLVNGKIVKKTMLQSNPDAKGFDIVLIDVEADSFENYISFLSGLIAAQTSAGTFDVQIGVRYRDINNQSYNMSAYVNFIDDIPPQPRTFFTPLNYELAITGATLVNINNAVSAGANLTRSNPRFDLGLTIAEYTNSAQIKVDSITSSSVSLIVEEETPIFEAPTHSGFMLSTWFATEIARNTNITTDGTLNYTSDDLSLDLSITLSPFPTSASHAYEIPYTQLNFVHSWKSYNWDEEKDANDYVEDVREVDQSSFTLIRHQEPAVTDELPLQFIPWSSFENRFDKASMLPGQPTLVTEDPTGRWRFYPALDRKYTVKFRYGRQPQNLIKWNDRPKGLPEEWEDLILWRALQYYGEYDEQPSVANRGRGNYKNLLLRFERQTRPKFYFKAKRLY